MIAPLKPVSLLDVGCGEGQVLGSIMERGHFFNIFGLEISKTSIMFGRDNFPILPFVNGSIFQLPFPTDSIDLVICTEVLEHLSNPEKAIIEIRRVTSNKCILSVPNEPLFMLSNFFRGMNLRRWGNDIEHIQHWDTRSFMKFLEDNGLIIEKIKTPFPWTIILASIKHHE